MKKTFYILVLGILIGSIIYGGITYAMVRLKSEEVSYNDSTVKEALDTLYQKVNGPVETKKFCKLVAGSDETIGSKYECDPGDGVKRNFYILSVENNTVDLIMESNLTDTVGSARTISWYDAIKFFRTGEGVSIKNSWTNVLNIDLPKSQAIADAVGNNLIVSDSGYSWWCMGSKTQDLTGYPWCNAAPNQPYSWLFNHLIDCKTAGCEDDSGATSDGYWMTDLVSNTIYARSVSRYGSLNSGGVDDSEYYGVRPVITVLKSNLYK